MNSNLLEVLLDNIPYSVWLIGIDGRFIFVNKYYSNALNLSKEYIIGKSLSEIYTKEVADEYIKNYNLVRDEEKPNLFSGYENGLGYHDGSFLECYLAPIKENGEIKYFLGILQNQSERKKYEEELINQKELLNTLVESIPDGIYHKDKDGKYLKCNNTLVKDYYKITKAEIIGKDIKSIYKKASNRKGIFKEEKILDKLILQDDKVINTKNKLKEKIKIELNRKIRYIESIKVPVIDKGGVVTGIVGVVRDVTENVILENKLKKMSYRDKLTGLYNRAYFDEKLKELNNKEFFPLSFVMGDLNGLKVINDAIGHLEGDKILKEISGVIKNSCRKDDLIFRWGGDEFCILLPKTTEEEAEAICNRIRKNCKLNHKTIIPLSIALGVSSKKESKKPIDEVLVEAEDKVYREKLVNEKRIKKNIIDSLNKELFLRHDYIKEHINRVKKYAVELGKKMNLSEKELKNLKMLAKLHDIGKVGIPEEILSKPGKLKKEEYEIIKTHAEKGYRIAMFNPEFEKIAPCILAHHERYDGTGYPLGLKGDEIPLLARIINVVDSYDAMTNKRVYKKSLSAEEAKKEFKKNSGTQFDPIIVEKFLELGRI
ncbi:TPA: diguanylate cyclase [Clostridium perfringens]|uniref:HD domain-containing phosphohydrolase n=1 Tax=Clostridium perfringens TaxID=1502 RepID=UPI000E1B16C5|nr:HD domain-containing phosphohydrolase [Clostridium perfringens]UBK84369.1 diguanylate cyclase [Clostridium perfringens]SUY33111.1 sensory box-containing diguanylate cyclase [Clostridium perfringens]HBI7028354.1 diguanylate cyclase [Clostridium perfringens]HBI7036509.1 diguanylate cyclase [Clostridium perfringens]HBI7050618.1 diguanylate cyclase [Clostridium perfringens]